MNLFIPARRAGFFLAVLVSFLMIENVYADFQVTDFSSDTAQETLEDAIAQGGIITFSSNLTMTLTHTIRITNAVYFDGKITNLVVGTNLVVTTGTNGLVTNQIPVTNVFIATFTNTVGFSGPSTNSFRLFEVAPDAFVIFDHIKFVNGGGSMGGAISNGGNILLTNTYFGNNRAKGRDGHSGSGPSADAADGANGFGGAIYNSSNLVVLRSYFSGNFAIGGEGGDGSNGSGDSLFGGNGGRGGNGGAAFGGAIYNRGILRVSQTTYAKNKSLAGNGGFGGVGGSAPFPGVSGDSGVGGFAYGGAVYNTGVVTNVASLFAENRVLGGDGMAQFSFKNGPAGGSAGGGALFNNKTLVLLDCTLATNTCQGGTGGGAQAGALLLGGTGGSASGGAVYNLGASFFTNCTFAAGNVTNGLGGISLNADGFHDGAPGLSRGGNLFAGGGSTKLLNSIVAYGLPTNAFGLLTDLGHNLSSDRTGNLVKTRGSIINMDPKLGPLMDNGGHTFTMALGNGSPAIDKGTNQGPPFDQRGTNRVDGKYDIGAFELTGPFTVAGSILYATNSPVADVVIEVIGTNVFQVTTNFFLTNDVKGAFSFVVDKGIYTIIPRAPDTNLIHIKTLTTNVISSIDDIVFNVTPIVVRGRVVNLAGTGMIGVKLLSTNAFGNSNSVLSGVNGVFKFDGIAPVENIITPISSNAVFIPASRTVSTGTNVNFIRIPTFTISGVITSKVASIVVSNLPVVLNTNSSTMVQSVLTDRKGRFAFSNVIQGTYLVEPQATNLVFTPTSKSIRAISNITNLKFIATNAP